MDILRFGHRLLTHNVLNRALKVTKLMLVFVWLKEQQCGGAGDTGGHQESHSAAHQEAVPAHAESGRPPQQRLPHHEALLLWWQWVCPGTVMLHCLRRTMKRYCLFPPHQSHPRWLPTAGLQGGRMWQSLVWRSSRALQSGRGADGLPHPESACVGRTRTTEKASGREPPEGDQAGSSDRLPTGGQRHGGDRRFCLLSKRHLFYSLDIFLSDYTNVLHKLCYRNRVRKCTKRIFPLKMVCPRDDAVRKLGCSKRLTMLFL